MQGEYFIAPISIVASVKMNADPRKEKCKDLLEWGFCRGGIILSYDSICQIERMHSCYRPIVASSSRFGLQFCVVAIHNVL